MGKSVRVSKTKRRRSKFHRDLISDLPECLISRILSRLTITDALRTSVLAKGWKVKWKSIYNVRFDDCDIKTTDKARFFDFILTTLVNLGNVERFSLYCSEAYDLGSIQACLNYVCRHNLKTFKVFMIDNEVDNVELSSPFILFVSLLNCKSLEKLKLSLPCIFKVLARNEFQNLKKLNITYVRISNMSTLHDSVFFSFPVLEHFVLYDCEWSNVKSVEIYAPKLITYECEPRNSQNYEYSIKIVGAKLKEFIIHGSIVENFDLDGSTIMNAEFRSYNVDNGDDDALMKLGLQTRKVLRGCSSIKQLGLIYFSKALAKSKAAGLSLPLFHKLENLVIEFDVDIEGLLEVLHATPFLKFLQIYDYKTAIWQDYDFGVEKYVPSCVVSCLEKVAIGCYLGATAAPQYELVKFLVENGAVLKTLIFYQYDEANTSEIYSKLSTFSKASSCLEIVLDNTWKEKGSS